MGHARRAFYGSRGDSANIRRLVPCACGRMRCEEAKQCQHCARKQQAKRTK